MNFNTMRVSILFLLMVSYIGLAEGEDGSAVSYIQDYHYSKSGIVKAKKKVPQDVLKVQFDVNDLKIVKLKDHTSIHFKIKFKKMQFSLYPEVGIYVFAGLTPSEAKLVGVSQHGGEVNLKLGGQINEKMKLYIGGQGVTLMEFDLNRWKAHQK